MGDILIKHLAEIIPGNNDNVLIDPASTPGSYKRSKVANLPGGSGSTGALQLASPSISLSVISASQINVSWSNVANESGYVLERSLNNVVWVAAASLGANVTSFSATGLASGTLHYFRVRAIGDGISYSNSEWNQASATTSSGSIPQLATPTLTAAVISSTQINLSWTNVANETGYQVQQSLNGTTWTTIGTPAANAVTLNVTGLTAATLYYFRVKAVGDGVSYTDSAYGTDSDTTSSGGGSTLSTPTGFVVVGVTTSTIQLDWNNVASATGYIVQRSNDGTTGWADIYDGSASDHTDTGLSAGVTRYYRVKAYAAGFTDSAWATVNGSTSGGAFTGYITWSAIDTDLEQYNTSKGIRKKAAAADSWLDSAVSNETLVVGRRLIGIADSVNLFSHLAISTDNTGVTYGGGVFGIRQDDTGIAQATAGGALGSSTTVVADKYLSLFYQASGTIKVQWSTDGTSWTDLYTLAEPSGGAPYYVWFFGYSPLASYKEVYIA